MPGSVEEPKSDSTPVQLVSRLKADPRHEDARSMTKLQVRAVLQKKAESDSEQQRKKNMKDFSTVLDGLQEDFGNLAKSKNPIIFGSKLVGMVVRTFAPGDAGEKKLTSAESQNSDGNEPGKEKSNSELELQGAARCPAATKKSSEISSKTCLFCLRYWTIMPIPYGMPVAHSGRSPSPCMSGS